MFLYGKTFVHIGRGTRCFSRRRAEWGHSFAITPLCITVCTPARWTTLSTGEGVLGARGAGGSMQQLCFCLSVLKSHCQCSTDGNGLPFSPSVPLCFSFILQLVSIVYKCMHVCVLWVTNYIETYCFSPIFNSNLDSKFYSYLRQWCTQSYTIHPLVSVSKSESTTAEKSETDFLVCQFIYFLLLKATWY